MRKRALFACLTLLWLFASTRGSADDVVNDEHVTLFSPEAMGAGWKLSFASLDDWIARIGRKGWRVLYKKETKEDYIALFLDDQQSLVVATRRLDGLEERGSGVNITAEDGKKVYDANGITIMMLRVVVSTVPMVGAAGNVGADSMTSQYITGQIYPIRKGYTGKIRIVKTDSMQNGDDWRTIFDYTLQWPVPK